jgi:hypothetical protein
MAPVMATPVAAFPMVPDEFDLGIVFAVDEVRLRLVEFIQNPAAGSGNASDRLTRSHCRADGSRAGDAQHSGEE